MIQPLESSTTAALSLALEAAGRRHQSIAANIANANTEGYVPVRLAFQTLLTQARSELRSSGGRDPFGRADLVPELDGAQDEQGPVSGVQLDLETAEMASNAVHYQALLQGLSRHLAMLSAAAGDGRR